MKIILLTSTESRHKYIASQLNDKHDLVLVVTETKSGKIEDVSSYSSRDKDFLTKHFSERRNSELEYFGAHSHFPSAVPHLSVPHGQINSEYVLELVNKFKPDLVVLFGTSIVKGDLLEAYEDRMINLHLGLSPYYKGSATNLFPIADGKLECVGSTIHIVSAQVDAGDILHQVRPTYNGNETLHDVGNTVILESGKVIGEILEAYAEGNLIPIKQTKFVDSKICRLKNITPDLTRRAYRTIEQGLVSHYLENYESRVAEIPIIDYFKK